MFRFLLLTALALTTGAAASAQTTLAKRPAAKQTARNQKSAAAKPATPLPAKPDGAAPVVRRPTGSTATADGKGQGVYAAPGEAVKAQTGKVESYRGEAPAENPRKPIGNTLGSGTSRRAPAPAKGNTMSSGGK